MFSNNVCHATRYRLDIVISTNMGKNKNLTECFVLNN